MAKKSKSTSKRIRVTFDIAIEHEPGARLNEGAFALELTDILDTDEIHEQIEMALQDNGDEGFPGEVISIMFRTMQVSAVRR